MAREGANHQPASLTLMAGPIDTRIAPTKVNELANEKPIEWFRDKMIGDRAGAPGGGAARRVYPGFLQLSAFMSMNAERHAKSFVDLFQHRVAGDFEKADAIHEFYEEYFAIMDLDRRILSGNGRAGVPEKPAAAGQDEIQGASPSSRARSRRRFC